MGLGESKEDFEKAAEIVKKWEPPSEHKVLFLRRCFEIEQWIANRGWTEEEEIISYAIRHFNVDRPQARQYLKRVIEDFQKAGVKVINQ